MAFYPAQGATRALVLFSVGFGGDRNGYAYLARFWSKAGFATAVVEHVGSNLTVLRHLKPKRHSDLEELVAREARKPEELTARPLDLVYVHSQLHEPVMFLAGHSYGAYTAMVAAGGAARIAGSRVRFKQAIPARALLVMSPQPPGEVIEEYPHVPTMVMTGTNDNFRVSYRERMKVPHDRIELVEGADHMTFAGVGLQAHRYLPAIQAATLGFWEDSLAKKA